jgi:hypothetical protein
MDQLPKDVLYYFAKFLKLESVMRLRSINKNLKNLLEDYDYRKIFFSQEVLPHLKFAHQIFDEDVTIFDETFPRKCIYSVFTRIGADDNRNIWNDYDYIFENRGLNKMHVEMDSSVLSGEMADIEFFTRSGAKYHKEKQRYVLEDEADLYHF